jgi:hypothetical protein
MGSVVEQESKQKRLYAFCRGIDCQEQCFANSNARDHTIFSLISVPSFLSHVLDDIPVVSSVLCLNGILVPQFYQCVQFCAALNRQMVMGVQMFPCPFRTLCHCCLSPNLLVMPHLLKSTVVNCLVSLPIFWPARPSLAVVMIILAASRRSAVAHQLCDPRDTVSSSCSVRAG